MPLCKTDERGYTPAASQWEGTRHRAQGISRLQAGIGNRASQPRGSIDLLRPPPHLAADPPTAAPEGGSSNCRHHHLQQLKWISKQQCQDSPSLRWRREGQCPCKQRQDQPRHRRRKLPLAPDERHYRDRMCPASFAAANGSPASTSDSNCGWAAFETAVSGAFETAVSGPLRLLYPGL